MTMTYYANGYGLRERPPECEPLEEHSGKTIIHCPCCDGRAEHAHGAGMDADCVTCEPCEGWGYFHVSVPNPSRRVKQ